MTQLRQHFTCDALTVKDCWTIWPLVHHQIPISSKAISSHFNIFLNDKYLKLLPKEYINIKQGLVSTELKQIKYLGVHAISI
jgi:hypothetical protein